MSTQPEQKGRAAEPEAAGGQRRVVEEEPSLQQRLRDLEDRAQAQAREIRALEKIEALQDHSRDLETENRALQERVAELRTFLNLSTTLSTTLNMEELFRLALHLIGRSLHVEAYSLMLLDGRQERLVVKAAFGLPEAEGDRLSLRLGEGISGLVAQTGQAMQVPDIRAEPRCLEQEIFRLQRGSFICVPLRLKRREVIGVLNAHKPEPHGFGPGDLDLLQAVATQVVAALENAQLYQRTKELSARDELTGLFNRRHFFETLEKEAQRAVRYHHAFSVLLLDLDDFKRYNDTYGHLQGDEALKALARLLLAKTRRADVVARFGGEEFVLLLPETTAARARVAAEKIRAAVEQHPFPGRDTQPGGRLTVTLGVATCLGDAEDTLAVVDLADRAMYLGKEQGGNQVNAAPGQRPTPPPAT